MSSGDERAKLAFEIECHRLKKYIGAYSFALGRIDAIVFTAGVGEMSPEIRGKVLEGLEFWGIKYDPVKNSLSRTRNAETFIHSEDSRVKIFVIPTDEELVFVEDVVAILEGRYDVHTKFRYSFEDPNYVNPLRAEEFKKELERKPELKDILAIPPGGKSIVGI